MNSIRTSVFALATTVVAVIGFGATASGDASAEPLLAQYSGSAHYGPFGEPPLVVKDTTVTGSGAMPTVEPAERILEVKATFGQPPLVIKDTAVMGSPATPTVEPFESNFPERKPAQ